MKFDVWDDADGDGAGDPDTEARVCSLGEGQVTNADDCDDGDAEVSPFSTELCDGLDQDCDGVSDDGLVGGTWYRDTDGDRFGDPEAQVVGCVQPADTTLDDTDCDDTHAESYPGALEVCDGLDNNCDTLVDDADPTVDLSTGTLFYADGDDDGYGNDATGVRSCVNPNPTTLVDVGGDCDDEDPLTAPGANEICDRADNNCDGLIDEDDPLLDLSTTTQFYEDLDNDGAGNDAVLVDTCFLGPGYAEVGGDCDDTNPALQGATSWVNDLDFDGVGAGAPVGAPSCVGPPDTVPVPAIDDCDDLDATRFPGNEEICEDTIDQDCDGADDPCSPQCTFDLGSYVASATFTDRQTATTMNMAFDGTSLWSCSGGGGGGTRLSEYDATGAWLQNWATVPDFRSVFTKGDGTTPLYSRAYNTNSVQEWNGVTFVNSVLLTGLAPGLGTQGVVVWDSFLDNFVATTDIPGAVHTFDELGTWQFSTQLINFGSLGTEANYPQQRSLAVSAGGCWLTYDQRILSAWDSAGNRVDTTTLTNAGQNFDSYFSLSYADGMVWVVDLAGGTWRGYDVGF